MVLAELRVRGTDQTMRGRFTNWGWHTVCQQYSQGLLLLDPTTTKTNQAGPQQNQGWSAFGHLQTLHLQFLTRLMQSTNETQMVNCSSSPSGKCPGLQCICQGPCHFKFHCIAGIFILWPSTFCLSLHSGFYWALQVSPDFWIGWESSWDCTSG